MKPSQLYKIRHLISTQALASHTYIKSFTLTVSEYKGQVLESIKSHQNESVKVSCSYVDRPLVMCCHRFKSYVCETISLTNDNNNGLGKRSYQEIDSACLEVIKLYLAGRSKQI